MSCLLETPHSLGAAPTKPPAPLVQSAEPFRMECCAAHATALGAGCCCEGEGKVCPEEIKVTLLPRSPLPRLRMHSASDPAICTLWLL